MPFYECSKTLSGDEDEIHVVEAKNAHDAIVHLFDGQITARAIGTKELAKYLQAGVKIENALPPEKPADEKEAA